MKSKILLSIGSVLLTLALCGTASAEGMKIGYVKSSRLLQEAPQVGAAEKKLEREFSPRKNELVAMQKDLLDLEDKLSRDAAIMKPEEKRSIEKDIVSKRLELKRLDNEVREDFTIRRNELLSSLQAQMNEIVRSFAKKNGFELVLADGAVYVSDQVDVTDEVLQEMKIQFEKSQKAR